MIDIEKAFDRVWLDLLKYKMIQVKYPTYFIKLINSYLRNIKFQVKINDAISKPIEIAAGVLQGSVLGPRLFIYYINDIIEVPKTNLALYTDDTAIYAHSFSAVAAAKQIQIHVNMLESYKKWKIKINAAKTELVLFSKKVKDSRITTPIRRFEHSVSPRTTTNYLVVTLDQRLSFYTHTHTK